MTHRLLQDKETFDPFRSATQVDSVRDSPLNHALIAVAQEVSELLQAYSVDADSINHAETIAVCTTEPEYSQGIDLLTKHEPEMLTDG